MDLSLGQGKKESKLQTLVATLAGAAAVIFLITVANIAHSEEVRRGEYIVVFKESPVGLKNLTGMLRAKVVRFLSKESHAVLIKRSPAENPELVLRELRSSTLVEFVQPNFVYRMDALPNDPDMSRLWGFHNNGQKDRSGSPNEDLTGSNLVGLPGVDLDAPEAWRVFTGSDETVVAVIDSGVDFTHPELTENAWVNIDEAKGKPGVDDDGNGYVDDLHGYDFANDDADPSDDVGHGTHCAGTIGARGDNGTAIAGVNWKVKIMALKFLDKDGAGTSAMAIEAIDYAVKKGARVLNNSWGGAPYDQALFSAIERASKNGVLFVAAAGNDRNDNDIGPHYPASYNLPNIISVAAINNRGELASFSNYGKNSVDIAAPGVNIFSTVPNNSYEYFSGTSMAAPHVSGVAALVLGYDRSLDMAALKARILSRSKKLFSLNGKVKTAATISAYHALTDTDANPADLDPSEWTFSDLNISTLHPYQGESEQKWTVHVPGAQRLSLFFEKFDTEYNYDKVLIYDANNNLVGSLTGRYKEGVRSSVIEGDTAYVKFVSDDSVNRYGFDLTRVYFSQ